MSPQSNCVACQGALVCTYAGCVSIRGRVGDTCPQFIEALAEECGTHGQQAFSALAAPAHACTAKARFELLCAAFDHTGRAGPSLLAHLQVVHAPSALTNIASLALRHGGLFGALARRPQQLLCDACGPSLLAVRLPAVAPALARSVILTVQCLACGRQVAFGMIPVDALMTEMRHRLLPHPRDAIPAHQRRVGVFPPPLRLSPRQLAERFWAAEMRNIPDVARMDHIVPLITGWPTRRLHRRRADRPDVELLPAFLPDMQPRPIWYYNEILWQSLLLLHPALAM